MSVLGEMNRLSRNLSKALTNHLNELAKPLDERLRPFGYSVRWLGDDYVLLVIEPQGLRITGYFLLEDELDSMMKMSNADLMKYCDSWVKS